MVSGKKRKPKHSLADVAAVADEYDESGGPIAWGYTDPANPPDTGPSHEGDGEPADRGVGAGGRPGAVGEDKAGAGSGASEDALWYVVCLETKGKRHIKEVRVQKGHRITFGPMAMGGRFPACWRVYDGKELIFALTGVVWFHRRDFVVRDYGEA